MDEIQARTLREAHDGYVRRLSRMTVAALRNLYREELAGQGSQLLFGGPSGKDELISALTGLRYPLEKLNESIHVLYHRDGIVNSACELCHDSHDETGSGDATGCDCALGRAATVTGV